MEQDTLLGRIENKMRDLQMPVSITLWDGRRVATDGAADVDVTIHSPKVLTSLIHPSMGKLARHYVEQQLDLKGEPRQIIRLGEALSGSPGASSLAGSRLRKWIGHTRVFDRKAIHHHYDVSDDFFGLWLDTRRVYSCGYFRRADDTLDLAQEQKLDHICRKLMLKPGERFLRISTNMHGSAYRKKISPTRATCSCSTIAMLTKASPTTRSQAWACSSMSGAGICRCTSARSFAC